MDNVQKLNQRFEALAWGALFIWWGIAELFQSLPDGIGAVGIGGRAPKAELDRCGYFSF